MAHHGASGHLKGLLAFSVTGVWATYRLEEAFPAPSSIEQTSVNGNADDADKDTLEGDLWKDHIQEELSLDKISE